MLAGSSTKAVGIVALAGSLLVGTASPSGAQTECALDSLAQAAAADTAHLRRVVRDGPVGASAEGASTTFYLQDGRPRVVVITYFGETGRARVAYFLASDKAFVVEREELRYAEPIAPGRTAKVVSRLPSVFYFCEQKQLAPLAAGDIEVLRKQLGLARQLLPSQRSP